MEINIRKDDENFLTIHDDRGGVWIEIEKIPIAMIFIMIEDEHISSHLVFTARLIHAIIVKKVKSNNKKRESQQPAESESHKNVE